MILHGAWTSIDTCSKECKYSLSQLKVIYESITMLIRLSGSKITDITIMVCIWTKTKFLRY